MKIKTTKDLVLMLSKNKIYRGIGEVFSTKKEVKCKTYSGKGFGFFPQCQIDMKGFTASFDSGSLIFLTHVYENGFLLGFRSANPCGTCSDLDQSWVVIDTTKGEQEAEYDIKSYGFWNTGIKEQKHEWQKKYGNTSLLKDEYNERKWKLSDDN